MVVYIVLRNGKVDEVFSSYEAAQEHVYNLLSKWAITEIVVKEVKEI